MADNAQSVCDCIQGWQCWEDWARDCCGCCGPSPPVFCGTCSYTWERDNYGVWAWLGPTQTLCSGECVCSGPPSYPGSEMDPVESTDCRPNPCGYCNWVWELAPDGSYSRWMVTSNECADVRIPDAGGWWVCNCTSPTGMGPHNEGDTDRTMCKLTYIIVLYSKGRNLIGINRPNFGRAKQGCGTCGSKVRKQATTNEVRKEALAATPRRKLF
jgi:hypothetical protein